MSNKMTTARNEVFAAWKALYRKGNPYVSRVAIKAIIGDKKTVSQINTAIKQMVESGILIQKKQSFSLAPEFRKFDSVEMATKVTKVKNATKAKVTKGKKGSHTVLSLKKEASMRGLSGYSRMRKDELLQLLGY